MAHRSCELLAVATVPRAPIELYLGALRAQSRTSLVALIQAVRAPCARPRRRPDRGLGTVGAGLAVLASQAVVAALISSASRRVLTGDRAEVPGTRGIGPCTPRRPTCLPRYSPRRRRPGNPWRVTGSAGYRQRAGLVGWPVGSAPVRVSLRLASISVG